MKIRPMLDNDSDYQLMAKWLSNPRVYEFVHGKPKNLQWVKNKYSPRIQKKEKINACFIEFQNRPIGYIQYFNIKPFEKDYELENTRNVW
ncbi:MAG: GNAT family N-acetyltransferase, partial [Candidatus Magasanikbacteria bacterium]|nr:GNAT family N-acetyltransferase [Candidatus Magasanikbacteria bacterium]